MLHLRKSWRRNELQGLQDKLPSRMYDGIRYVFCDPDVLCRQRTGWDHWCHHSVKTLYFWVKLGCNFAKGWGCCNFFFMRVCCAVHITGTANPSSWLCVVCSATNGKSAGGKRKRKVATSDGEEDQLEEEDVEDELKSKGRKVGPGCLPSAVVNARMFFLQAETGEAKK